MYVKFHNTLKHTRLNSLSVDYAILYPNQSLCSPGLMRTHCIIQVRDHWNEDLIHYTRQKKIITQKKPGEPMFRPWRIPACANLHSSLRWSTELDAWLNDESQLNITEHSLTGCEGGILSTTNLAQNKREPEHAEFTSSWETLRILNSLPLLA